MAQIQQRRETPGLACLPASGPLPARASQSVSWLEASTRVATAMGELRADALWPYDRVFTPRGPVPVAGFDVWQGPGTGAGAPVVFSPGAIGNAFPLRLGQRQPVLVQLPEGRTYEGQRELLLPALALVNGQDICLRPCKHIAYVRLILERGEVIVAEGALCEAEGRIRGGSGAPRLDLGAARLLLARLRGAGGAVGANTGLPPRS